MKLNLIPSDFENSSYGSNEDCPLARASKRELGYKNPSIGGISFGDDAGDPYQYEIGSCYLNKKLITVIFDSNSVEKINETIAENKFVSAYVNLT